VVATDDEPLKVVVADVNGDGKADLAAVSASGLTILLGDGSGGWQVAGGGVIAAGDNPVALAVGDLNGDGKISPAEEVVYNIFKDIIAKTQKNGILTNLLIVVFCVVSFLFSVFGVAI
jgi:hypothetical protein